MYILHSKEKRMILSTIETFQKEQNQGTEAAVKFASAATGVSRASIYRILKEQRDFGTVTSPKRPERGSYKPVDSFDTHAIRRKVNELLVNRKILPTLRNHHTVLKEEIDYIGSRELLRQSLKKLGFSWKATQNHRKVFRNLNSILYLNRKSSGLM